MEWLPPRIEDSAEFELLRAVMQVVPSVQTTASSRQSLYQPDFVWADLIGFAAGQDVLPPLIWAMRKQHLLLPVPRHLEPAKRARFITTRLDDYFNDHAHRLDDLRIQLNACVIALNQAGVTPLLLKGARYLLATGTEFGTARPMRDIDILIRPHEADSALNALTGIGYIADAPTGLQSHHLPELRLPGRHGVVELHVEALAPAGRQYMSTDFVWQAAEPTTWQGNQLHVLPPVWQAYHAMLHHQASDDGYRQAILALKPLWEFSSLAADFGEVEWLLMAAHSKGDHSRDLISSWCLQAEYMFGLALPASLPISAVARAQMQRCLREARQHDAVRRSRFIIRQLGRGFSAETLAARYDVQPSEVGVLLRVRHLWFLVKRYRGAFRERLLGRL